MVKQNGFSLIELLIVVLITGLLAAIAIPNLLASRRAANEASAIATVRIFRYAALTYVSTTGNGLPPSNLDVLFDLGFITKGQFAVGSDYSGTPAYTKSGYAFEWAIEPNGKDMNFSAFPTNNTGMSRTGTRNFVYLYDGNFYYYYTSIFNPNNAAFVGNK